MTHAFGKRRAEWSRVDRVHPDILGEDEVGHFATYDLVYRSLCSILYNFAQSGHPGGSVSTGRIVTGLLLDTMDYDIGDPNRRDADILSYAAGHKALGLYAMLALRDEVVRVGDPGQLPGALNLRLRLEDLLGFRRNPTHDGPLFREFRSKPLDGHPTPATPFVKLSTGASGVGLGSSLGLALAAADAYGRDAPRVHIIEGEGGLTPGRAYEAAAFAGASGLHNAIVHLDWNQASIDSNHVTREGGTPGEYVQWDPMEFFYLHDWNVVEVPDGFDLGLVLTAQQRALALDNGQPTAIVYRTVKGWHYGLEGRKSHGAGHKLCSDEFRSSLEPLFGPDLKGLPTCEDGLCLKPGHEHERERCWWEALVRVREILEEKKESCVALSSRVARSKGRLDARELEIREGGPAVDRLYAACDPAATPAGLELEVGTTIPLRKQLGLALGHLNQASGGALLIGAADLLDSTAISAAAKGFDGGFFHAVTNPGSRTLSMGGICEDGMSAVLSGLAAFGLHVGAGASYGAFLAPLGHIAARLHAIGNQMRQEVEPGPYRPFVLICGHAGLKTGEDGPTHADPQALQLVQENFAPGTAISLTPWEPQEIWPLLATAFAARPAVIYPFVTRPGEPVLDRAALGLAPADGAVEGVYRLRAADEAGAPAVVLQGSEVTYVFVQETLPRLLEDGLDVDVYYVASAELFDGLPASRRREILPLDVLERAMGITGFTFPTLQRWIPSGLGREHSLHPFRGGHYLGSGPGARVVHEAGLDGAAQAKAIRTFADALVVGRV